MSAIEKAMQKLQQEGGAKVTALKSAGDQQPIVEIAFDILARLGFESTEEMRTRTGEEFRRIKRPLLKNVDGDTNKATGNRNVIVVTSTVAGEGKTFSALNLALSIAKERERTVLLIDADGQRRSMSTVLGVEKQRGLLDVLEEEQQNVRDVLLKSSIANFSFIPAGKFSAHATELFASSRMLALVKELSTRYSDRVIVVDSPPLQVTSEASVLASIAGQIVVVVEAAQTPKSMVKTALEQVDRKKCVGLILNKESARVGQKYRGGYYYGYY